MIKFDIEPGEGGLDEDQFEGEQAKLREKVAKYEREYNESQIQRPDRMYFFFESAEKAAEALKFLEEQREFSEVLKYLTDWRPDPNRARPEGIELKFSQSPPDLRSQVEGLLAGKFTLKPEFHEVVGSGDETEERHEFIAHPLVGKVIQMPRRGDRPDEEKTFRKAA